MSQISIFDGSQRFIIRKPIRLIELFGGYGSQALALRYIGVPFEHHALSEWAVKSIQAYKDMHEPNDNTDYSKGLTLDELKGWLLGRISSDYSTPMTEKQIDRLSETETRKIYNNMFATKNLGSIMAINGKDLQIKDTDEYCYITTYSFPCQDLSSAGKGAGMGKDSGTRSGLLWEVERLLTEVDELPQVLLMENVPEVIGSKNMQHFQEWIAFLDSMGYKSKWEILNGTDFEIPQNRKRCFMVSVLGDYYYDFPQKLGRTLRLKDLLEKNVSEEYYLSDNILNYFIKHTKESEEKGNGFRFEPTDGDCTAKCVTTRAGGRMDDNFIVDKVHSVVNANRRVYSTEKASPTITTCGGGQREVKILEPISFDYRYDEEVRIRNDGFAPTINSSHTGTESISGQGFIAEPPVLNDADHLRVFDAYNGSEIDNSKVGTICTNSGNRKAGVFWVQNSDMRVRKLTPRECFRLMGVKDEDFERVTKNQSKSSLYHLAGDSIITSVLMALFGETLDVDWREKVDGLVKELCKEA